MPTLDRHEQLEGRIDPLFAGPGEMRARCRAFDWATTPLGPVERWPASLRTAVGIVMASPQPMWVGWGPDYRQIYNDAYLGFSERHPASLGRPVAETWSDVWHLIGPDLDAVYAGGAPVRHEERLIPYRRDAEYQDNYFDYSYSAIPDADAPDGVGGVLAVVMESTARIARDVAEIKRRERNEAFLLEISRELIALTDIAETMHRLAERIGRFFGVAWCMFGELVGDGETAIASSGWNDDGKISLHGAYRMRDFLSEELVASHMRGEPSIVDDTRSDPRVDAAGFGAMGVLSFLLVPFVREGEWRAQIAIADQAPRQWSDAEVALLQELAERMWLRLARARAEQALRASEERQRYLLKLSDVLRPLGDPLDIQREAARILGEQLGADRAFYATTHWDRGVAVIERDHVRGYLPSVVGEHAFTHFTAAEQAYRAGMTLVVYDVEDPEQSPPADLPCYQAFSIRSVLSAPLVKEGVTVATMTVHTEVPHRWSEAEISLVEETGERTWAAVVRARAEAALRESEARQSYLVRLNDALRSISDAQEVQRAAMHFVGEHLQVDRVHYAEFEPDGQAYVVADNYVRAGVPKRVGRFPVSAFPSVIQSLARGESPVVTDVRRTSLLTDAEKEASVANRILASIGVPLVKEGRLVAQLGVFQSRPRQWTSEEVLLLQETAERTWAAVERARAEQALQASEEKYRGLFDAIDEAFAVLEVIFDGERAVDLRYLEANPVAVRMTGVGELAGRRIMEFAPNIEPSWLELLGRVARTGIGERHERPVVRSGRTLDLYVFKIGSAHETRVAIIAHDATLRARRARHGALLSEVSRELIGLTDIETTMQRLGERIGRFFGVQWCMFSEVLDGGETAISSGWNDADKPSLRGVYRMRDFLTAEEAASCNRGEPSIVGDTRTDPRVSAERYGALGIRSFVIVPLVRDREWRFRLAIVGDAPRQWADDEVALIRELAERIWIRLEHARAEEALRERERQYRMLFDSIDEGFAVFELLLDEAGQPFDLRYLEANAAYERQAGCRPMPGQTMREVFPEGGTSWLERYAEIARTRRPQRFVDVVEGYDRWFDVYAFPTDAPPERMQLAALFRDVTAERTATLALASRQVWLAAQNEAFRAAVNGAPLEESLGVLARTVIEQMGPDVRGAFYLANDAGTELHHVTGMPDSYAECVDGFRIAGDSLACGLAVYTGRAVITADVQREPRWTSWLWLAERHDFRAVWSFPVETAAGHVVGTFAMYFAAPRDATAHDHEFAAVLTRAAAIIISRAREAEDRAHAEAASRASEEKYRGLFEAVGEAFAVVEVIFDGDRPVDLHYLEANPAAEKMVGIGALAGRRMTEFASDLEPYWLELFGRVARTGVDERHVLSAAWTGRTYDVYLFKVGAAHETRVASMGHDVTGRGTMLSERLPSDAPDAPVPLSAP